VYVCVIVSVSLSEGGVGEEKCVRRLLWGDYG